MYELLTILLMYVSIARVTASCQNKYVINRGLSCEDKELILDMHNQLRQSVALGQVQGQPSASSMMLISWDEELAKKAQDLANTCHYGHDSNSARAVNRFYVGQNIATTWSTWERSPEPDFASQIKAWFNEVDSYSFSSGFSHATGHYSQMVWGDTYLIGCGFTYFYDGYRYQKIYVCNYGPGGNVAGKTPYYPGSPSCDYNGMISSSRYYGLCDSYRTYYPDYACSRYRRGTGKEILTKAIVGLSLKLSRKSNLIKKSEDKVKEILIAKPAEKLNGKQAVNSLTKHSPKSQSQQPVSKQPSNNAAQISSKHLKI